jgi:glycine oxidase
VIQNTNIPDKWHTSNFSQKWNSYNWIMSRPLIRDVVIAGGGIIGLSIGLELLGKGLSVMVLERHRAMQAASWAAGGMLAVRDPENPPGLLPLSLHSLALYPAYLERIQAASKQLVPLRTSRTLQQIAHSHAGAAFTAEDAPLEEVRQWIPGFAFANLNDRFLWLEEQSLDPRDLCHALPAAFLAGKGTLLEGTPVLGIRKSSSGIEVTTARERIHASVFVNCCGAWAGEPRLGGLPVEPVKGQVVTVALNPERLRCVLRTPEFYAIPRGDGRVTIGATIEHVGFDQTVEEHRLAALLRIVSEFLPEITSATHLESWAGLRPGTPDGLPILGADAMEHCWHATGHYRNGVLLAPVTARVIAQAIFGELPDVPLENFSPSRFASSTAENTVSG